MKSRTVLSQNMVHGPKIEQKDVDPDQQGPDRSLIHNLEDGTFQSVTSRPEHLQTVPSLQSEEVLVHPDTAHLHSPALDSSTNHTALESSLFTRVQRSGSCPLRKCLTQFTVVFLRLQTNSLTTRTRCRVLPVCPSICLSACLSARSC